MLASLDCPDSQVCRDSRETPDTLELLVATECPDLWDPLDPSDPQDLRTWPNLDPRETPVCPEFLEFVERRVCPVWMDLQETMAHLDCLEDVEMTDSLELLACLERREWLVCLASLVWMECPDLLEDLDTLELLDLLALATATVSSSSNTLKLPKYPDVLTARRSSGTDTLSFTSKETRSPTIRISDMLVLASNDSRPCRSCSVTSTTSATMPPEMTSPTGCRPLLLSR